MSAYITCIVPDRRAADLHRRCQRKVASEKQKALINKIEGLIVDDNQIGVFFGELNLSTFFWEDKADYKGALVFDIADNKVYDNCEHLIRADWVNEEEEEEWGNLEFRLTKIKRILDCILEDYELLELYIGTDDGSIDVDCYETKRCRSNEFIEVIIDNILENLISSEPEIHLIVEA